MTGAAVPYDVGAEEYGEYFRWRWTDVECAGCRAVDDLHLAPDSITILCRRCDVSAAA